MHNTQAGSMPAVTLSAAGAAVHRVLHRVPAGRPCLLPLLVQVDIERSYALVLHKLVRRINGKLTHSLRQALDEQLSLDANCQFSPGLGAVYCGSHQAVARLQPLTNMYQAQLVHMAGLLDVRVFRRVARELWNAAAGVGCLLWCMLSILLWLSPSKYAGPTTGCCTFVSV